jgi:hypothetical protein
LGYNIINMVKIIAQNKQEGAVLNLKLLLLLLFFVGSILLSWFAYSTPLATITIMVASIVLFVFYTSQPVRLMVELTEEYLKIDSTMIYKDDLISWAGSEHDSVFEVVLKTKKSNTLTNFYLSKHNPKTEQFLEMLENFDLYDEKIYYTDTVLNFMKVIGIK